MKPVNTSLALKTRCFTMMFAGLYDQKPQGTSRPNLPQRAIQSDTGHHPYETVEAKEQDESEIQVACWFTFIIAYRVLRRLDEPRAFLPCSSPPQTISTIARPRHIDTVTSDRKTKRRWELSEHNDFQFGAKEFEGRPVVVAGEQDLSVAYSSIFLLPVRVQT